MTATWPVRPLRAIADVALGRQRSPERAEGPNMVPYLRAANVKDGRLDLTDVKSMDFSPSEQKIFALRPGDVLVTEGAGSLAAVGASGVYGGEIEGVVCFQNTLLRLRPRAGTDSRFLMWWARHAFGSGLFASIADGANIFHLSAEGVRDLPAAVPDLQTQRNIADYIDSEAVRVDRFGSIRRKQADLVRVRTVQAIVEMVDLDAATRVPLRRVVDLLPGFAYRTEDFLTVETGVRLLRGINVDVGRVRWDDVVRVEDALAAETARFALASGDVVLGMDRPVISSGVRIAQLTNDDTPARLVQRVARLRARPTLLQDYLYLALQVGDLSAHFEPMFTGVSVPHVSPDQILAFEIPLPSRARQRDIVSAARRLLDQAGRYEAAVQKQLDHLTERRQALITAAVTGALETPGVAA